MEGIDIQAIVRQAVQEFVNNEQAKTEPAHKGRVAGGAETPGATGAPVERTGGREQAQPARWRRKRSAVRRCAPNFSGLGVGKIDLAFRAVQDGIVRTEDGRLVARNEAGETPLKEYLTAFVNENPEFLPARIAGWHGNDGHLQSSGGRPGSGGHGTDSSGNERRRNAAGTRGNRARSVADPEGL